MKTVQGLAALVSISLVGGSLVWSDPSPAPAGGGTVKGKITFKGDAPKLAAKKVEKDAEACGHTEVPDESLQVGEGGGLKNAVVLIRGVAGDFKPDDAKVTAFDQKGCLFDPHVLVVQKGAKVSLKNSDKVAHNVNLQATKNAAFNEIIGSDKDKVVTFGETEKMSLSCNIHNWMNGWIVVHDSPFFAVTDDKGEFSIAGVPAGEYEVQLWHEKAKGEKQKVKVADGADAALNAEMTAK